MTADQWHAVAAIAAVVAAIGALAGPFILYRTRKGSMIDRVNERIENVRRDMHVDVQALDAKNETAHAAIAENIQGVREEVRAVGGRVDRVLEILARRQI